LQCFGEAGIFGTKVPRVWDQLPSLPLLAAA
jgi:hypothetical protein